MSLKAIKDLDPKQTIAEHYLPNSEKIIEGKPEQRLWQIFSSIDKKFHAGIWDAKSGSWKVSYDEDEFCYIVEGESVIHDAHGNDKTVKAGDCFTIAAGFQGVWEVPRYCKKIYVIYEA